MNKCPDSEVLEQFLNGTLDGTAADTLTHHIETCVHCQSALESLTSSAVSKIQPSPAEASPRPEFLDRLKAKSPEPTRTKNTVKPNIPGYELLEEIGQGGVGSVYKARQIEVDRIVALKILLGGERSTDEELARFRTEAEAAGQLNHPGIVRVYQVGTWLGVASDHPLPYVCLEYVGGGTLDQVINRSPQQPKRAAEILRKMADAVHAAHEQGVIHRDLKPANVLLDASGEPKIADFGIAKRLDLPSGQTQTGMILGTPSYMAPEQARGDTRAIGPRTDVYGLGAVLYEMLTGRPPFRAPTALETVVQVSKSEPISPKQLQPNVPRDLETICLKCLRKEPEQRYDSARSLAEDLDRYLTGRSIVARPVGPFGRLLKWGKRNPAAAILSSLLLWVVFGSIIALTYLYLDSEKERKQSDADRKQSEKDRTLAVQARGEAELATEHSKRAEKSVKTVNGFFQKHVLAAPRPKGIGAGEQVTLLQAIDEAEKTIPVQFEGQPEVEAAIRDTLVNTYYSQGQFKKSRAQAERVLELRLTFQNADDPEVLSAQNNLALSNLQLGNFEEAEKMLRQTLEARQKKLGPGDPSTIASMNSLSGYLIYSGRYRDAAELLQKALELLKEQPPADDSHLLTIEINLANVYVDMNREKEAEPLLRDALRGREQKLPADHPDIILTMNGLSTCLMRLKKYDEASRWNIRVIESSERTYGKESPQVLDAKGRSMVILAESGKSEEAAAGLRSLIDGPCQKFPIYHPTRVNIITEYMLLLLEQKKPASALPLANELLNAQRKVLPSDHLALATTLAYYSECLLGTGKPIEAEKLARECVAIRAKKLSSNDWRIASANSLLGDCIAKQKQYEKAEKILVDSYRALVKADAIPPNVLRLVRERIIDLYKEWGKPDELAEWERK